MYTTTINQNGMILLNKSARKALGLELGDKVMINFDDKIAKVEKRMSDEEFFEQLDALKSEKTKKRIKELSGKSADELFDLAMTEAATEEIAEGSL